MDDQYLAHGLLIQHLARLFRVALKAISAFTPPHITNYSLKFFITWLVQAAFVLNAFYTL
jgi:hypothetical protein